MKTITILTLVAALISLTSCSSMRGNVVPQSGPTMEQVYDGVDGQDNLSDANSTSNQENLNKLRKQVSASQTTPVVPTTLMMATVSANAVSQQFRKLPNPEIKMYVYPHLAGQDQVPVPGYFTAFNVYDHDYYALPQE